MVETREADVVVVGGGPAGAATATMVAQQGHRVVLLERERFPRYHIGESLIPATWPILERLGMIETLRASAFPQKHSVQFFSRDGRASTPFYFEDSPLVPHPQTWQVVREEFDQMMLDNAREHGVEVHEGVNVREVLFDGDRARGVRAEAAAGEPLELAARVVVDASGQSGLIANHFGLRAEDPGLRNAAFFTYFKGAQRDPGRDEGATLVLQTEDQAAWFWVIPMPGDRTSVGVVAPMEYLTRPPKRSPQEVFDAEFARCPGLVPRLVAAEQLEEVQVLKDYTYWAKRRAGDGWVLVGDAYGFIDPLYSSGVFLALKSAELAADAIADGFATDDLSGAKLGRFEADFLSGMEAFRKLVHAFYDPSFSLGGFLREHPHHRDDVVQILVGNVFYPGVHDLFVPMAGKTRLPEPWV